MKIKDINIPSEHRYLSELMDFLPGNCILNKGMCGCGGTTLELTSKRNSLILVPTINLVLNKAKDEILGMTGDTPSKAIEEYMSSSITYKKIMCTYDSLKRLLKYVDTNEYFLLIDEYHLLFGFMWICDFMTIIHSIKTKKAVGNRFRWLFCFNRMYRTYVVSRLRNACLS